MGLCLSRSLNDSIRIETPEGRVIDITVIKTEPHKTRLHIEADLEVVIHRKEIWDKIQQEGPRRVTPQP